MGKTRYGVKRHTTAHIQPVRPKNRGDFDIAAIPIAEKGGCGILKKSDPEDDMAFLLWSAYVGSPRHSTRVLWDQYENQPVFFRMAHVALSICAPAAEITVSHQ